MLSSTTNVRSATAPLASELGPVDDDEHDRARFWRRFKIQMSLEDLSLVTGYSVHAIRQFEKPRADRTVNPAAWRRYKCCCGYVDKMRGGGGPFFW